MSTVGYIVRDMTGSTQRGSFAEGTPSTIYVSHTKDVSLNLGTDDVTSYQRHGQDLHLVLSNGETLVLSGYFDTGTTGGKNLFLSQEGNFVEVILEDGQSGVLYASYETLELTGKWSAYDEMVFLDVDRIEPVVAPLAAPLFGGLGAAGAAAGAVVVGGAVIGGGDGGGGGTPGVIVPTVDDVDVIRVVGGTADSTVTVTGTGAAGSTVEVTIGGQTQTVTIDDDGNWSADFDAANLPADGIYTATVHVVDLDGNTFDLDGPEIDIDTTAPTVIIQSGTQSTGDIVNAEEHGQGPVITGTGEAGATVDVEINGTTHSTTVAADGTWSVTFAASEISTGEYDTAISITTTDSRGNSSTTTDTLVVDTVAPPVDLDVVEGDDIINAAEATDGVVLSGTGEAGSTIVVEFQGLSHTTMVGADGTWSASFDASAITAGTYGSEITVTATDPAGNSYSITETVQVDTEVGILDLDSVTIDGNGDVGRISTQDATDSYSVSALESNGTITVPAATQSIDPVFGTEFTFDTPISDGTHLVVSNQDAAGNNSSTLVVLQNNATNAGVLDHSGLGQFDVDAVNLDYAADANLVLTEAQIKALSVNSDTLTIHGGADDSLSISDATNTGQTQVIDGQTYDVYSIGSDGTTLIVEQDVNVTII